MFGKLCTARLCEFAKHFVALYQQSDGRDSRPDLVTFRSILGGMSRSRDPNAAEQGEEILRWMQGLETFLRKIKSDVSEKC